jgi:predicted DNA-binding transcriptional regulator YafY
MKRQNRPAFVRLAWLVDALRVSGGRFKIQELADEYEVERKTIERDLEALRQIGSLETEHIQGGTHHFNGLRIIKLTCPWCDISLLPTGNP